MVVLGGVEIEGGSVRTVAAKGFALYGSLHVSATLFTGNRDSLFALQSFGCALVVEKCTFQGNTSPAGTLLLVGISGTNSDSSTVIRVEDCTIVGNGAYMGGSFIYLSVSPNINLSPAQMSQSRAISVRGNVFNTNPGYLCILFSQFLNITFDSNTYTNHNYGFLVKLYSDSVTLANSSTHTVNRFLILTYLVGIVQLQGLNITHVTEGPAILIMNSANQALGYLDMKQVHIRNFTLLNVALFSATLFAYSVRISVTDFWVSEGSSYACALGCFFFNSVIMTRASMDKVVVEQGASVGFLGTYAQVTDLRMTNSTLTRVGYTGVFYSVATFYNMVLVPGIGSYVLSYQPDTNIIISFDSVLYVKGAYYDFPPVPSYVAFYIWNSHGELYNITFQRLHANIADVYSGSSLYIKNMTILSGRNEFLAFVSFNSNATYEDIRISDFVSLTLFSVLDHSSVTAKRLTLSNVSIESIGIASKSELNLVDITLKDVHAETLFWYCTASSVQVTGLVAVDSTFDLTQFFAGTLILRNSVFVRVTVKRRFITAQKATIIFDNFELDGLIGTSVTPFAQLTQHSTLTFKNSNMRGIKSREQGLVFASDSTLIFEHSSLSDFNVTFLYGVRSTVRISDSEIFDGGLMLMDKGAQAKVTAGLLDCMGCNIYFANSQFRNISGTDGGVVSLIPITVHSLLEIDTCVFEYCAATKDGGVIHAIGSHVFISSATFLCNSADRGAGLYFECYDSSECGSEVTFSHFANNSAREGAAVKWTLVRPHFSNNTSAYNKAVYGEFEASIPTHMLLANSNTSVLAGVPGVIVIAPILIVFVDAQNQIVATDDLSAASINSTQIIGTTYVLAKSGIANFSSVIVQTVPGTTVFTRVDSPTISAMFPNSSDVSYFFDYQTRVCLPGEVSSSKGCYLCPKNTYSVDPLESECRPCPGYATCPGGHSLLLDQGYWRISELKSDVYTCPIASACLGGQNSTCADGYVDRLCSRCLDDYYMAGLTYCIKCEKLSVRAVRISIFLVILLLIYIIVIRKSTATDPSISSVAVLTTLKILFNFLQSVLMISLINVDWKPQMMGLFSANEMFVSLALSSLNIECFERKF